MRTAIASTRSFNSIKERLKPAKIQYLASSIRVSTHAPTWSATSTTALTMRELTFQSTRPRGARPHFHGLLFVRDFVSIHAPTWGATVGRWRGIQRIPFQSTRPRGARLIVLYRPHVALVSIHAPTWGATTYLKQEREEQQFQSTRPRGARQQSKTLSFSLLCFNPRAHVGRDKA